MNNLYNSDITAGNITIHCAPDKAYVNASTASDVRAAVTIQVSAAPARPDALQGTVFVILVDTSGSMEGPKLDAVRAAMSYLLDQVDDSCFISIISFSSVLCYHTPHPIPMTADNKEYIRTIMRQWAAGGSTNLSMALLEGWTQATRAAAHSAAQLVLLTDGHHTKGADWPRTCGNVLQLMGKRPLTINTFAIGQGPNSELLTALALGSAGGAYEYMQDVLDVGRVFGQYVGGLKARVCEKARLTLYAQPGCRIDAVDGVETYNATQEPEKTIEYHLGGLCAGVTKSFVLHMRVRPVSVAEMAGADHRLLQVVLIMEGRTPHLTLNTMLCINRTDPEATLGAGQAEHLAAAELRIRIKNTIKMALWLAAQGQAPAAKSHLRSLLRHIESRPGDPLEFGASIRALIGSLSTSYNDARNAAMGTLCAYSLQQNGVYTTYDQIQEGLHASRYV